MKKLGFAQALQLLGNAGVIIGIFLLVYELNQNRQMMEAQTRHEIARGIVDQLGALASDEDLTDLTRRARCGLLESGVEAERYFLFINSRLRYWEDAHYQYRQGLYDESEFLASREAWRTFIQPAATQAAWDRMKSSFSPEFVEEIDSLIAGSNDMQFLTPDCG